MECRFRYSVAMIVTALMVALLASANSAAGQSSTAAAAKGLPSRLPDGQPNIQGFWSDRAKGSITCDLETGWCDERHTELTGVQRRPPGGPQGAVVDPKDGKLPYQPSAIATKTMHMSLHGNPTPDAIDPQVRCFVGVPRLNYQSTYQIVQPPGYVVFLYEREGHRIIPLDSRPPLGESIKLEKGSSRGHWEGNTLVVEVTNFNDWTWFDVVGDFHSDAMRIVERFTFVDADTINYQATIDDPKVFTRPWTIAFPIGRNRQKDYEQWEWACREGERDLQFMHHDPNNTSDESFRSPGRPIQ